MCIRDSPKTGSKGGIFHAKTKKVRLPLLILTVPVILLYLLFALQPPDDYSDPAPNAIWSETIAGYGTGTPYNMINTSGKVAKRTSERYCTGGIAQILL